jgi:two-component sensor histidine kinase
MAAALGELLVTLLEPCANAHSTTERVHILTPKLLVGEKAATTLALVVYELVTNSTKYGAVDSNGTLDSKCRSDGGEKCRSDGGGVKIVWRESGGPPTARPSGFGTKLIINSLSDQLGGTISANWPTTGAVITLKMSQARLGT